MSKDAVYVKYELVVNNLLPALMHYVEGTTLQEFITSDFPISEFLLNSAIRAGDIKLVTCIILGDSKLLLNWAEDKKLEEIIKEMNDAQFERLRNIVLAFDNDVYKIVQTECARRKLWNLCESYGEHLWGSHFSFKFNILLLFRCFR